MSIRLSEVYETCENIFRPLWLNNKIKFIFLAFLLLGLIFAPPVLIVLGFGALLGASCFWHWFAIVAGLVCITNVWLPIIWTGIMYGVIIRPLAKRWNE